MTDAERDRIAAECLDMAGPVRTALWAAMNRKYRTLGVDDREAVIVRAYELNRGALPTSGPHRAESARRREKRGGARHRPGSRIWVGRQSA